LARVSGTDSRPRHHIFNGYGRPFRLPTG
jgi:hypothetical protein